MEVAKYSGDTTITDGPKFIKALFVNDREFSLIDVIDGKITWRKGYGVNHTYSYKYARGVIKLHMMSTVPVEKSKEENVTWRNFMKYMNYFGQSILTAHDANGELVDFNMYAVETLSLTKKLSPATLKALETSQVDELAPQIDKYMLEKRQEAAKDAEIARRLGYVGAEANNNRDDESSDSSGSDCENNSSDNDSGDDCDETNAE